MPATMSTDGSFVVLVFHAKTVFEVQSPVEIFCISERIITVS